jgi:hypothetical protein
MLEEDRQVQQELEWLRQREAEACLAEHARQAQARAQNEHIARLLK